MKQKTISEAVNDLTNLTVDLPIGMQSIIETAAWDIAVAAVAETKKSLLAVIRNLEDKTK